MPSHYSSNLASSAFMFKTKFILKVIKSDKDCGCGGENANDAVRREAAGPGGLTFRLFYGAYSKMIFAG